MKENVGPLRQRIAKNLKHLLAEADQSPVEVADAAKVDRKTINNLVNARFDPRMTQVEKVAKAFGIHAWQLLATDLASTELDSKDVLRLLDLYARASPEGRAAIIQVASAVPKSA